MADIRIVVNTSALTRLGSRYRRVIPEFQEELDKSQQKIATDSAKAFAAAARRHGYVKVAEGVQVVPRGNKLAVTVSARDPETGYDYALITRVGHRVTRIVPKSKKFLKFPYQGKILYRRSVKAWSPTVDWADEAIPVVHELVHVEAGKLKRRLIRKLGTGR
jgi:hypothetical protein